MDVRTNRPQANPTGTAGCVQENNADALTSITKEIDDFLHVWMRRLDWLSETCQRSHEGEEHLQRRIAEFDEERRRWEEQRQIEIQQFDETAQQLAEAWSRLENGELRLRQNQQAAPHSDLDESMNASETGRHTNSAISSATVVRPVSSLATITPCQRPEQREAAVRQFEQLRREIDCHRSNTRRPLS